MKYLLINTAVAVSNIVLIENDKIVSVSEEENANDLSSKIFFMIDEVFKNADFSVNDLDKIFIVNGPGSFTGIRIGMAIAKVMAWALKIDLIPISCLELLATTKTHKSNTFSIIDARRGYVYAGGYDENLNVKLSDQYIMLEQLLRQYPISNNNGYVSYDTFEKNDIEIPKLDFIKIVKKHEFDKIRPPHFVNPVYLKQTEAEEKCGHNVF